MSKQHFYVNISFFGHPYRLKVWAWDKVHALKKAKAEAQWKLTFGEVETATVAPTPASKQTGV